MRVLMLLGAIALVPVSVANAQCAYPSMSRQEVKDVKTYDVFLAPSCKNGKVVCKAWERDWPVNGKPTIGDVISPEDLVYREKTHA